MESNGKALADVIDPATGAVWRRKAISSAPSPTCVMTAPPPAAAGFAGSWTPKGNQMANRDNADPSGLGNTLGWAWAWPLNRRILYNRASADPQGNPWDPTSASEMGRREMGRRGYSGLQHCRTRQRCWAVYHAA
jgi:formate dehydrogenase major subunit